MNLIKIISILISTLAFEAQAQTVAQFNMSLSNGSITEAVSSNKYPVTSQLPIFTVNGIDGEALRFDGYSNYVKTQVPSTTFSTSALTLNVMLAAETYPMMVTDVAETSPTYATICGNLNETTKDGFALQLSSQGDLQFKYGSTYANGYVLYIQATEKLPRGQWALVSVVMDKVNSVGKIYLNGREIGSGRMNRADMVHSTADFFIGKDNTEIRKDGFLINTFCGLIDDISIYNKVYSADELATIASKISTNTPDFKYPDSRYAENFWRPQFHGMPSGGWTNESHGLIYSDGKYHVFFQKNANGPYMSRLHWGHISSENLYKWTEEPIAIAPGESYDMKGCWSGCVYTDGTQPTIIYTAVDNQKARIVQADATTSSLNTWQKQGVIIDGKPVGLSDDFRDPYFFTINGQKYIIVGTSKDNIGACTLHKYVNGAWTNDGSIFFHGTDVSKHGRFWEMPNITDMGNGKWLFTCTPLDTSSGVHTLYWIGTINFEGKFVPDNAYPQNIEMNGISKEGYGLLSPSIFKKDGKVLILGIVPDKLPGSENYKMGWAHNYSLPREISIGSDGSLIQKPYEGLTGMRTSTVIEKKETLNGIESLSPVAGRQIELQGDFTVGSGEVGFSFLKSGDKKASLTYYPENSRLTLDISNIDRTVNDGVYGGVYSILLPEKLNVGDNLNLHVYLDGSILDIFVNNKWAYSVRVFPTNATQIEAEVFSASSTNVNIKAWILDANQNTSSGITSMKNSSNTFSQKRYNLSGQEVDNSYRGIIITKDKKIYGR